ncbi:type I restriction enzyme, S subunit [Candidatus Pantoea symbiotica]|uniref:Type I restriction enzyme, S subunit n=1 Tax=Candidatus Pantoea symbiotica TaxID=1884370 RepID=A0A1I4BWT9_9GAMM|nr:MULTISPECIES: restriction endonuclease subunit S [Pantoea]SFK72627.1 type I restriction enzyme, S subunit [Pantoea symbiotica]SFV00359.1 type I restriction enzyme, S subunit [Pantoea sp. YR525]
MIPEGWLISTLENLIDIKHGFAFKSDYFRSEGEYILTTPGHFFEVGGFRDQGNKTKYYVGEVPKGYILNKGDVLLAMTEQAAGLLGSAMYVPHSNKYLHNQRLGLVIVLDHERVCKEYIYLIYNSSTTRKIIAEQASGTKVKHTSPSKLLGVNVLIPPLSEQKKIAKILSTWDKAITTTEQLLNNSQQQKKALMQQLLTGKKRLTEFSGAWESAHLCNMAKIVKGKALSNRNLIDGEIPVIAGGKSSPYKHRDFTHEDVITVSASGAYAGYVSYHPYKIWASDCSVVVAREGSDTGYIYQLLTFRQNEIYSLQSGGAQPHIYPKDLESLKVIVPSLREQKAISSLLAVCDKEIKNLLKKLHFLKQEKKALMQQLLTGKRRVKTEAA